MIKFLTLLGYDPAKHSVKVEMLAGLTTFLTMSYILAVNPLSFVKRVWTRAPYSLPQ